MFILFVFVFLFNLVIRQEKDGSLLSKIKNPFSTPIAYADHPAESAESGCGCECGSCESGCAVTGEISQS